MDSEHPWLLVFSAGQPCHQTDVADEDWEGKSFRVAPVEESKWLMPGLDSSDLRGTAALAWNLRRPFLIGPLLTSVHHHLEYCKWLTKDG